MACLGVIASLIGVFLVRGYMFIHFSSLLLVLRKITYVSFRVDICLFALLSSIIICFHIILDNIPINRLWIISNIFGLVVAKAFRNNHSSNPTIVLIVVLLLDFLLLFLDLVGISKIFYSLFASQSLSIYEYSIGRHVGILGNPNISGAFYGFCCLYCFLNTKRSTVLYYVLFIISFILLILCLSRTAIAAFVFCVPILVLDRYKNKKSISIDFVLLIFLLILFYYISKVFDFYYISRLLSIFDFSSSSTVERFAKLSSFTDQIDAVKLIFGGIYLDVYDNDYLLLIGHIGFILSIIYVFLFLSLYKSLTLKIYFCIVAFFTPILVFPVFIYLSIYIDE